MIEKYEKAGKMAKEIADRSRRLVKPGARLLDIAETIEGWINEGAKCAFPLNISLNERAAHYTPPVNDETVLGEKDVVKVDLGVHVDGFIGDTAYTIDLSGEWGRLVEAAQEALNAAIAVVKAGVTTDAIGREVEQKIKSFGYKPVQNLTGHLLGEYELHSGLSIPNVEIPKGAVLEEGMVVAIEPFASSGDGFVHEERRTEIFSYEQDILTRNRDARQILEEVKQERRGLPFAERWLARKYEPFRLGIALRELILREAFHTYPVLRDSPGSHVAQAEATVVVEKEGCRVLT
jgi:methionyl aminopeptidase